MANLIATTDGIEVKADDIVEVQFNGGEWMQYASIKDKTDASYAINRCRQGSVMNMNGDVTRYRIVRREMGFKAPKVIFERAN